MANNSPDSDEARMEQVYDTRPPIAGDPDDRGWFTRWANWRAKGFREHAILPAERPADP